MPSTSIRYKLGALLVFAAAMGVLEAAVVVYLRELYYPLGFRFPLAPMPERIVLTEMLREAMTLVMLAASAYAAGGRAWERLAYFLFAFGVWDVFYYAGLRALTGWPESLLAWDVLFLIPWAWLGPVLAPLMLALTMIAMAVVMVVALEHGGRVRAGAAVWGPVLMGCALVVHTFLRDVAGVITRGGHWGNYAGLLGDEGFRAAMGSFKPVDYAWGEFALGEALILTGIAALAVRSFGGHARG